MNIHKTYRIDENQFIEAVKNSLNIHQALISLGLNGKGGAYKTFKIRCAKLNLDISHLINDKEKQKRSDITLEEIKTACGTNISRRGTLSILGLNYENGSNVRWLDSLINEKKIDTSHWLGCGHLLNKTHNWNKSIPDEKIFVENSKFLWNHSIKKRLIQKKILEYKCHGANCGINSWYGQKLSLQLEHINGDHTDNRIENLTFLCPNCHSLTSTFCRGQKAYNLTSKENKPPQTQIRTTKENFCLDCNKTISSSAKRCKSCSKKLQPKKIAWPDKNTLLAMLEQSSYLAVGKRLGVSDNAIRKYLKNSGANGRT